MLKPGTFVPVTGIREYNSPSHVENLKPSGSRQPSVRIQRNQSLLCVKTWPYKVIRYGLTTYHRPTRKASY